MTYKHTFPLVRFFTLALGAGLVSATATVHAIGVHNDFNGDGYSDLAIGVSADSDLAAATGGTKPGTVNVLYGSGGCHRPETRSGTKTA
jgi:hypothetical protein